MLVDGFVPRGHFHGRMFLLLPMVLLCCFVLTDAYPFCFLSLLLLLFESFRQPLGEFLQLLQVFIRNDRKSLDGVVVIVTALLLFLRLVIFRILVTIPIVHDIVCVAVSTCQIEYSTPV